MEQLSGTLYDHPVWYDLVFGSDWKAEFDFLSACFREFARGKVKSLFEPACGTGRLLYRFAKAGYKVAGLDLNPFAVDFCNHRLQKHQFPETVFVGDMANFTLSKPVDAAFNTINSFRHLQTERQARGHLRSMAAAVRPGGLYLLGLHLTPTEGDDICDEESWSSRRGNLAATSHLKTFGLDLDDRIERCRMEVNVYTPTKSVRIIDELVFRTYTADQMRLLLKSQKQWEVAATFDFSYNVRLPVEVDAETQDVVYVLRRTAEPVKRA